MIFTLEALQAEYGDSLILHWKDKKAHRLVLIDGGPPTSWKKVVRNRLEKLRAALHEEDEPLRIEMLMISHIDEDHVGGIVKMTGEMVQAQKDEKPVILNILDLWHNAFEDLLDDGGAPAALASAAGLGATAASSDIANNLPFDKHQEDTKAVVASVNQGRQLRDDARALAIPINGSFGGKLIERPAKNAKPKNLREGLTLEILGPRRDRLDELQKEWKKVLEKKRNGEISPAQVAAFLDDSPFNLSSVIAIARTVEGSMLLTGDARGDDILDSLEKAKLLKNGKAHFDVFKVPHHGSEHNVTEDFFRAVTGNHYVISANGRFDNPDEPMLDMLVAARGKDRYKIHLTNPVPHALKKLEKLKVKAKARFTLAVRKEAKPSMLIELGDKLPVSLRP